MKDNILNMVQEFGFIGLKQIFYQYTYKPKQEIVDIVNELAKERKIQIYCVNRKNKYWYILGVMYPTQVHEIPNGSF